MSKKKILICMVITVLTACGLISGCTKTSVETKSATVTTEKATVTEVAHTEKEAENSASTAPFSEMIETTKETSSSKTKAETEKPKSTSATEKSTTKPHTTAKAVKTTTKQSATSKETTAKKVTTTKKVTEAKQSTTQKADFDIERYVSYAKDYAASVGLELDSSATDCWDNPISANPNCKYIERDIKSRLNKYAKADDISAVWIWAEKTGSDSYNIYIGYA